MKNHFSRVPIFAIHNLVKEPSLLKEYLELK